jgi:luciferase family oxidoreductase group 1
MIHAEPTGPGAPEIWILGSSDYGAQLAAWFGLPYCFAYFFNDGQGAEEALTLYRTHFKPSAFLSAPYAAVTVWAFAAETQADADHFYQSRALARLARDRGNFIALPSPEDAAAYPATDVERARMAQIKSRALSGTAPDIATKLRALGAELGVQEIAITTTAYEPAARQKSYAVLARELGLSNAKLALAS